MRPEETLNLIALGAVSVVTVAVRHRLQDPGDILVRYAIMAAALVFVGWLAHREDRLPGLVRFLIDFYPAAFIPVLYETLGPLIAAARGNAQDAVLAAADRALSAWT